jgi:membrane protein
MNGKKFLTVLKKAYNGWSEDKAPQQGASLAYYTIFSLAPLLLIATALAGFFFGEEAATGELLVELQRLVGEPAASAINGMLKNAREAGGGGVTVVGLAILLFGASGVFVQLQDSLNTVWNVPPKQSSGIWGMVRDRLLSFTIVLGVGFLLLVSLVLSSVLTALNRFLPDAGSLPVWQVVNQVISFGVITLLFAMIYKYLPDAKVEWRDVWVGAAMTALLFTVGKYLIGLYLGRGSVTSTFGAAGSLVVVLVWVYYSAQILLFGAEFTYAFATTYGSCCEAEARQERPESGQVPSHA